MKIARDCLATAAGLSDTALLARVHVLAGNEREALAELLGHLAELDSRRSIYAARGHGSLFSYCTRALGLSEDAAYNRIEAARACRRFPLILDLIAAGSVTLTAVRMLARHVTAENHEAVLAAAQGRSKPEIEALMARLAPQPDAPSSIRRLPASASAVPTPVPPLVPVAAPTKVPPPSVAPAESPTTRATASRPVVKATAPERYRVQFTVGRDTHDKLRRLQTLLAREIPDGDPGAIFDRAVTALLANGALVPKRLRRATSRLRFVAPSGIATGGQCAFVAPGGRRCPERKYLELHHVEPYALHGPASVANIALRCRLHDAYEAELTFGPFRAWQAERPPAGLGPASLARSGRARQETSNQRPRTPV